MTKSSQPLKFDLALIAVEDCAILAPDPRHPGVIAHGSPAIGIPLAKITECLGDEECAGFSQWTAFHGDTRMEGTLMNRNDGTVRCVLRLKGKHDANLPELLGVVNVSMKTLAGCKNPVTYIDSILRMRTYVDDTIDAGHRDRDCRGNLNLLMPSDHHLVKKHRVGQTLIPDDEVDRLLKSAVGETIWWKRSYGNGTIVVGNLTLVNESNVLLTVQFGSGQEAVTAPMGMAVKYLSIEQLNGIMDIQEECVPLAAQTYRTLRNALAHARSSWEKDFVQESIRNRNRQLQAIRRTKKSALRKKLTELVVMMDHFIATVMGQASTQTAIAMIDHFIAGSASLNEELAADVEAEQARIVAEQAQEEGAITTVQGMMDARKAQRIKREAARLKREAQRKAAQLPKTDAVEAEPDGVGSPDEEEVTTGHRGPNDEADQADIDGHEGGGNTDEGTTTVVATMPTMEPAPLTTSQPRLMDGHEVPQDAAPVTQAPKTLRPTETERRGRTEVPGTLQEQMKALMASRLANPSAADAATHGTADVVADESTR